jgi:competence protein ComEC
MQWLWVPLERVAAWPESARWLPEPALPALLLALAGAVWCLLPRGVPGRALAACLLLPLLAAPAQRPPAGEADLWLLDTGQGLALLVRTARHDLLYDAGPATPGGTDLGETTVVPALRALSVDALERLVISHGDSDHAGGADAVRRTYRPSRELGPPGWAHAPMQPCVAGMAWHLDGVAFEVLHPTEHFPYLRNESSCVLRVAASGASALLPGDIGRHVEARLARLPEERIRADVLLAPHHGSDSSSSLDFIAAVRPGIVLLAVGSGNRFGLPKPIVLSRYDRYRARVHDTAGQGAIHVRLGRDGARVLERLRLDRPRYWRDAASGATGYASGGSGIER